MSANEPEFDYDFSRVVREERVAAVPGRPAGGGSGGRPASHGGRGERKGAAPQPTGGDGAPGGHKDAAAAG